MKKQILTDRAEKAYLQKLFECTNVMVWKALTFNSDSDLARRIRVAALKCGGKLSGADMPEMETFHDTETMTQTFGPRVKIVAYKNRDMVEVVVDDKVKIRKQGLGIPGLMELQGEVQLMASSL